MSKRKETDEPDGAKRQKSLLQRFQRAVKNDNLTKCRLVAMDCQKENDEAVRLLNYVPRNRFTFLHMAAEKNQTSFINWLLSSGELGGRSLGFYNVSAIAKSGETALHIAAQNGHLEACKAIVNGCRVDTGERYEMLNATTYMGRTILDVAALSERVSIITWILSNEEGGGRSLGFNKILEKDGQPTTMHRAAETGHLETCKAIVNGCRVDNGEREEMLNADDRRGVTVLHKAASSRGAPLVSWLLSDEEGGGRALGFNKVFAKTKDGDNFLHYAARGQSPECFKAALNGLRFNESKREEMINATTDLGWTVLHQAASSGRASIASWLLSDEEGGGRSFGFNNVGKHGSTALHVATRHQSPECIVAIVNGLQVDNGERQEMINAVDDDGITILHKATQSGRPSIIEWILSEDGGRAGGFNLVSARTGNGKRTALHLAADSTTTTRALLSNCTSEERMNLFLAVDSEHGWTVLHDAVRENRTSVLVELLSYPECGLIVNRKDNRGMTVLHRAIIRGIDKESRNEWNSCYPSGDVQIVRTLLGMNGDSSLTTTTTRIDPNIGLGI